MRCPIVRFREASPYAAINEATRLVAAGRPEGATAILQRSLGIAPADAAPGSRPWSLLDGLQERFGWSKPKPPPAEPEHRPGAGEFLRRSYRSSAGMRNYRLYIPSLYAGDPVPLVVMLHGCKQSPEDFATGTRTNTHVEELEWLAAYPEQPAAANGSRCWNWFRPEDQRRGGGEPELIAGITRQVMNDFAVDPARVYVAGLSAGGAAAAIMGSAYGDLYAAVGIHSGLACGAADSVVSAFAAMRQGGRNRPVAPGLPIVPTIVFHGDQDRTVNARNAETIIAQATAGIDLDKRVERVKLPGGRAYTVTRYIDRAGSALLEAWIVHGGGHAWYGGSPAGSYTDPTGPDATREMLRFFSDHRRLSPR